MPKEDTATVKQARAIAELSKRLDLPVETVIDHLPEICEILSWSSKDADVLYQ